MPQFWEAAGNSFNNAFVNAQRLKAQQERQQAMIEEQKRQERVQAAKESANRLRQQAEARKAEAKLQQEGIKQIRQQADWAKWATARWKPYVNSGLFEPNELEVRMEELTAIPNRKSAMEFINKVIADKKALKMQQRRESKGSISDQVAAAMQRVNDRMLNTGMSFEDALLPEEPYIRTKIESEAPEQATKFYVDKQREALNVAAGGSPFVTPYSAKVASKPEEELVKAAEKPPKMDNEQKAQLTYQALVEQAMQGDSKAMQGIMTPDQMGQLQRSGWQVGQPFPDGAIIPYEQWRAQAANELKFGTDGDSIGGQPASQDSSQLDAMIADLKRQVQENQRVIDQMKQGR